MSATARNRRRSAAAVGVSAPRLALILLVLASPGPARGGEGAAASLEPEEAALHTRLFLDGVTAYEEGDFGRAIEAFSEVAEDGVRNPKLYYNLGNAYLKSGELGPAILWYERAALLMPADPDLRYNLEYARGLTRDQKEESGANLARVLLFWRTRLGERAVRWAALGANAVFWGLLIAGLLLRRPALRRAAIPAGGLTLLFTLTALFNYYAATNASEAIVLREEVAVRSGLTDDSTELFRLHAGAKVRIDRRQGNHLRIAFDRDKIGWVPQDTVGRIRNRTPDRG